MPSLDVGDVLFSGDISHEELTVYRRTEVIGNNGRATITAALVEPRPYGCVQPKDSAIGGNEIERTPDGQFRGAALTCYTPFRMQAMSPGKQPDVLVWNGDHYVVTLVNDWTHFGAGYVEVELASMEAVDFAPGEGDA